jgi:hypothetical protein
MMNHNMLYKQTTQVPNFLFDTHLRELTEAELKILLITIRQTLGWFDSATGKRKSRDRITHSQFKQKTGLSNRIISKTINSLSVKKLIHVTDFNGKELQEPKDRRGKPYLFYGVQNPMHLATHTNAQNIPEHVHGSAYNKTNYIKLKETKLRRHFTEHISKFLPDTPTLFNQQKM